MKKYSASLGKNANQKQYDIATDTKKWLECKGQVSVAENMEQGEPS